MNFQIAASFGVSLRYASHVSVGMFFDDNFQTLHGFASFTVLLKVPQNWGI